ncbi:hypothetical protein Poli38472_003149 [Pythium oligandrum]|uniref:FCH domain-containing protein n=1 Tax=Pythium oligandrum TaxID=41045 RepID=A0A8K1FDS7_PYTOL|nr:hypothetical protein Poli38472_003149 [Pythium oligandrum]|eukprot:TMW57224.1 hypothetical protein Poli38472_003149 [Pythium oligandrum]
MERTFGMDDNKLENHWRRTFCQMPFPAIYEHAENGKRSLHRLVEFFRRKAEAERSASEELRSVLHTPMDSSTTAHLEDLEEHGTSIRRALAEVKNYVDASCHQHLLLARVLEEQVAEPLVSLQDASEMYIRTLKDEIRNVNDEYMQALNTHSQAAARLQRASDDLTEALERQHIALHGIGVPTFELQRLATRVAKCEEEKAQALFAKAQAKTHLYKRIVSRDEMAMAVSVAYQRAEEERLDQLHSCMQRFLHIEKERAKATDKMLKTLEQQIEHMNRSEDIQMLIHNHRNADNMHFQGKALALLDWHWGKAIAERERHHHHHRHHDKPHHERVGTDNGHDSTVHTAPAGQQDGLLADPIEIPPLDGHVNDFGNEPQRSPHGALADTPMGQALHKLFAEDSRPSSPVNASMVAPLPRSESDTSSDASSVSEEDSPPPSAAATAESGDVDVELQQVAQLLEEQVALSESTESPALPSPTTKAPSLPALEEIVQSACETHKGRALFVRCLNRQRSLETRLRDRQAFDALNSCFNIFLDRCIRDDDVKAAKTAMILAETFYVARDSENESEDSPSEASHERRERGGSWGFAPRHMGRGASRIYCQVEVKKHAIWKSPSFWEKALLHAIGEELQKTPQPCSWEDLPSGITRTASQSSGLSEQQHRSSPHSNGPVVIPTREEAVSRVHNIVFGQLGSFTLSMLEFEVPFTQIESFVETMCDAHELTEDQRFLLRKNLQEICVALQYKAE